MADLSALGPARDQLSALCVRDPPLAPRPGAPLLAALNRRVELVFTELAGNALRHADTPVRALLSSTADAWLISVEDASPHLAPTVGTLTPDQIGGRGLAIVATIAATAGWFIHDSVKTVWAELADEPPDKLLRRLSRQ